MTKTGQHARVCRSVDHPVCLGQIVHVGRNANVAVEKPDTEMSKAPVGFSSGRCEREFGCLADKGFWINAVSRRRKDMSKIGFGG